MLARTTESIEMRFGRLTSVGQRNHILDWVKISHGMGQVLGVAQAVEMHWAFLLRCTHQKGSFSPDFKKFKVHL